MSRPLAPRRLDLHTVAALTAITLAAGALGGCRGARMLGIVSARYSREYGCEGGDVRVRDLGAGAYRAQGCGREVTYVCVRDGWGRWLCATDTAPRRSAVAHRAPPRPPPHRASAARSAQIASAFAPASDAILACIPGSRVAELRLSVRADGSLDAFRAPRELDRRTARCVRAALDAHRAPADAGPLRAVTSVRFQASPPTPAPGARAEADAAADPGPGRSDAPADGTTELRAWIEAQREAILGCAERPTVLVRARWDASGLVTLAFGGELAGTPADGCLQSAAGAHRTTAGAAGTLSHLVRATPP